MLGVVQKLRLQKCPLFVNIYKVENVNVGSKKHQKLVNVVCECPLISSIFCKRKLEKEAFFDDKSAFICGIKNWFVPNRFDLELRSWKIQFWILHCRSAKPRSKCERKKNLFHFLLQQLERRQQVVGVTPLLSNVDLDKLLHAWKILFLVGSLCLEYMYVHW